MGFFTALSPLLARGPLSIRISQADDGKVKLLLVQDANESGEDGTVPLPPLRHTDTPEQLDSTLEAELATLVAYRNGPVQSVLDEAKALMDEAAAEEKRLAKERLSKSRSKQGAAKPAGVMNAVPSPKAEGGSSDDETEAGTVPQRQPEPAMPQLFD